MIGAADPLYGPCDPGGIGRISGGGVGGGGGGVINTPPPSPGCTLYGDPMRCVGIDFPSGGDGFLSGDFGPTSPLSLWQLLGPAGSVSPCDFGLCGGTPGFGGFTSTLGGDDQAFKKEAEELKNFIQELRALAKQAKSPKARNALLRRAAELSRRLSKVAHQGTDVFMILSIDPAVLLPCIVPQTPSQKLTCGNTPTQF